MLLIGTEEVEEFIKQHDIRYFRAKEFVCKHCKQVKIESRLIETLENLRQYLKVPVVITSAYRCPKHNQEIGGVPNSAHTRGYAVDIRVLDSRTRFYVVRWLLDRGINRIGIGRDFIHFDLDPEKPKNVIWHYYKSEHVA